MNRLYFCIITLIACINGYGQIHVLPPSVFESSSNNEYSNFYDSLTNIVPIIKNDYSFLIGQNLYFCADTIYMKDYGGGAFYKKNVGKKSKKTPYIQIPYNNFMQRMFKVLDIERYGGYDKYSVKLADIENKDTVYFRGASGIWGNYWTVEGFFRKAQQDFLSKEYYLIKDYKYLNRLNWLYHLSTDECAVDIKRGSKLKCIDVAIKQSKENRHSLVASQVILIFNSDEGKKYYLYLEKAETSRYAISRNRKDLDLFRTPEEVKKLTEEMTKDLFGDKSEVRKKELIEKYGKNIGEKIFEGEVEIGYKSSMCRDAWGSPIKINTSKGEYGTYEQWVYKDNRYLYFENDKLTNIQY